MQTEDVQLARFMRLDCYCGEVFCAMYPLYLIIPAPYTILTRSGLDDYLRRRNAGLTFRFPGDYTIREEAIGYKDS